MTLQKNQKLIRRSIVVNIVAVLFMSVSNLYSIKLAKCLVEPYISNCMCVTFTAIHHGEEFI
jgi:hypothetical protein